MATIKDIAKRAGVAVSTVSYAISGNRPISEEVKKRIRRAMAELDYQPNPMARALAGKGTRILGLILDPLDRSLGITEIELLSRAAEAARSMNYHLTLLTDDSRNLSVLEEIIADKLFDGFILMEIHKEDERVRFLSEKGLPFVIIGRDESSQDFRSVDIDFEKTAEQVLAHVKEKGHREAGFINQSLNAFNRGYGPAVAMKASLEKTARRLGIKLNTRFCLPSREEGENVAFTLLKENPGLTVLLVMNDQALPGILKGISALELSVPKDLSLISLLSSSKLAEMFHPSLTHMEIPSRELGWHGVCRLVEILEGRQENRGMILIPGTLHIGESTI